jgi:hypothetical protein
MRHFVLPQWVTTFASSLRNYGNKLMRMASATVMMKVTKSAGMLRQNFTGDIDQVWKDADLAARLRSIADEIDVNPVFKETDGKDKRPS